MPPHNQTANTSADLFTFAPATTASPAPDAASAAPAPAPPPTATRPEPSAPTEPTEGDPGADAAATPRLLPHLPGLDGLRGLAVAGVLLFHGGIATFAGGFLGVSTFFTLSGFLITALLLNEHGRRHRIDARAFWARRFRRLLPPALLAIAASALLVWRFGDAAQLRSFRADGLAAVGYVANWRFLGAGQSYGALFQAPSPLLHFWSLAIEEQFYLVFPLVAMGLLRFTRGSRRAFGAIIAVAFVASALLPRMIDASDDRIYFGTDARAAELLAGSLLAVLLVSARRPLDGFDRALGRARPVVFGLGVAGLVALVSCWVITTQQTRWVYQGGLALYALLSAFVVFSAILGGSPVQRVLSVRPMQALGRISYGVYLYHWPLLWVLTPARTGLDPVPRLLLVATLTLAVATLSYRYVEMPIRRGEWPRPARGELRTFRSYAIGAAAVVAAVVVLATLSPPTTAFDLGSAAAGQLITTDTADLPPIDTRPVEAAPAPGATPAPAAPAGVTGTGTDPGAPADAAATASTAVATTVPAAPGPLIPKPVRRPSRPLRVLVVGDSTALFLDKPLNEWGMASKVFGAYGYARLGCGVGRGGLRIDHVKPDPIPPDCGHWDVDWPRAISEVRPDLIVIASSIWDATDRQLPGETVWRKPGDPVYDDYLRKEFTAAVDVLGASGAPVVWIDNPPIRLGTLEPSHFTGYPVNDPARMVRLNQILADVAATRPSLRVIPYATFLQRWPGGVFDGWLRPDGLHVDGDGGADVAAWMGPEILDAYWSVRGIGPSGT